MQKVFEFQTFFCTFAAKFGIDMELFGITLESLGLFFLMVAIFYVAIFGFTMADLRSGVRKAKEAGMFRSSIKYRETISKLDRYYNMAIVLTILDCVIVFAMSCLGWQWYPHFPFATLVATVGIGCIEIKSIFEKWEDKQKMEAKDVAAALIKIAKDGNVEAIKAALEEFSNKSTKQ